MKVSYRVHYSADRRRTVSPARYTAQRKGDWVIAHITLHPILKKYSDLRRGVLGHEMDEIASWVEGVTASHRYANGREPRVTKWLGGVKGFWAEVRKREAKAKKVSRS